MGSGSFDGTLRTWVVLLAALAVSLLALVFLAGMTCAKL